MPRFYHMRETRFSGVVTLLQPLKPADRLRASCGTRMAVKGGIRPPLLGTEGHAPISAGADLDFEVSVREDLPLDYAALVEYLLEKPLGGPHA
jgi:hypothetical protein